MFYFEVTKWAWSRRSIRPYLLHKITTQAFLVITAVFPQVLSGKALGDESTIRPNVVLILADDLGFDEYLGFLYSNDMRPVERLNRSHWSVQQSWNHGNN